MMRRPEAMGWKREPYGYGPHGGSNMSPKRSPAKHPSWKMTGMWIVLMLLFFCQLLVCAWSRVQVVRGGYEITRDKAEQRHLVADRATLKLELARLKSPQRIAKIAREHLGLVPPSQQQTVEME
jgi:cell division protein FtsL